MVDYQELVRDKRDREQLCIQRNREGCHHMDKLPEIKICLVKQIDRNSG